ncbi:hypothetical protein JHN54_05810 [Streptomyces sp. MBT70]|nr:hypothetical protein [Streptomyces sp. MBT70]GGR59277.1 hypothetical protein GCM10010236_09890 [Streptomyces eurythermus]
MIVWLNRAFGGGKTTLAAGLCRALPGVGAARPFAPTAARRAHGCQQAAADWMHAAGHVVDTSALTSEQALEAVLTHLHLTAVVRPRPPEAPQA